MKFTKIQLVGLQTIDLFVVGASPTSRFIFKAADGLGPTETTLLMGDTLSMGDTYQGRHVPSREVVIRVGLNPIWNQGQTPEQLRSEIYGLLNPNHLDQMLFRLYDGATKLTENTAYVKRIEPALFAKEAEVIITMMLPRPYLEAPAEITVTPSRASTYRFDINNPGTAQTFFYTEISFTGADDDLWIYNNKEGMGASFYPSFKVDHPFLAGDLVKIDFHPENRMVQLVRGGVTTELIDKVYIYSDWYFLIPGVNAVSFGSGNVAAINLARFKPKYWGV